MTITPLITLHPTSMYIYPTGAMDFEHDPYGGGISVELPAFGALPSEITANITVGQLRMKAPSLPRPAPPHLHTTPTPYHRIKVPTYRRWYAAPRRGAPRPSSPNRIQPTSRYGHR